MSEHDGVKLYLHTNEKLEKPHYIPPRKYNNNNHEHIHEIIDNNEKI